MVSYVPAALPSSISLMYIPSPCSEPPRILKPILSSPGSLTSVNTRTSLIFLPLVLVLVTDILSAAAIDNKDSLRSKNKSFT